jgi:hypothetical protein
MMQLRVAMKPCSEEWDKMSPVEKGRFCTVCQKDVIDLVGASPETILQTLKETNGDFCGWFSADIASPVYSPAIVKRNLVKILAMAVFMNFCLLDADAQTVAKDSTGPAPCKDEKKPLKKAKISSLIKGKIKEEATNQNVIGAQVLVSQNGILAATGLTDTAGNFEIILNAGTYYEGSFDLITHYIGFDRQHLKDIPTGKKAYKFDIALKDAPEEFSVTVSAQYINTTYGGAPISHTVFEMNDADWLMIQDGVDTFFTPEGVRKLIH